MVDEDLSYRHQKLAGAVHVFAAAPENLESSVKEIRSLDGDFPHLVPDDFSGEQRSMFESIDRRLRADLSELSFDELKRLALDIYELHRHVADEYYRRLAAANSP